MTRFSWKNCRNNLQCWTFLRKNLLKHSYEIKFPKILQVTNQSTCLSKAFQSSTRSFITTTTKNSRLNFLKTKAISQTTMWSWQGEVQSGKKKIYKISHPNLPQNWLFRTQKVILRWKCRTFCIEIAPYEWIQYRLQDLWVNTHKWFKKKDSLKLTLILIWVLRNRPKIIWIVRVKLLYLCSIKLKDLTLKIVSLQSPIF